jgi:hypothetical protein
MNRRMFGLGVFGGLLALAIAPTEADAAPRVQTIPDGASPKRQEPSSDSAPEPDGEAPIRVSQYYIRRRVYYRRPVRRVYYRRPVRRVYVRRRFYRRPVRVYRVF